MSLLDLLSDCYSGSLRHEEFWMRCPYHTEDTASFSVNIKTGVMNCFGCAASGHIRDLLERDLGKEEAEKILNTYGCSHMVKKHTTKEGNFWESLKNNPTNTADQYLEKRGLSSFGIEYRQQGDRVIVFPIRDEKGTVIALQKRNMQEGSWKYMIEADFNKYNKTDLVFGLDKLDPENSDALILVEGIFDYYGAKHCYPDSDCLALLGKDISDKLIENIAKKYEQVYIWLDNDKAGKTATKKILKSFLLFGIAITIINSQEDPADTAVYFLNNPPTIYVYFLTPSEFLFNDKDLSKEELFSFRKLFNTIRDLEEFDVFWKNRFGVMGFADIRDKPKKEIFYPVSIVDYLIKHMDTTDYDVFCDIYPKDCFMDALNLRKADFKLDMIVCADSCSVKHYLTIYLYNLLSVLSLDALTKDATDKYLEIIKKKTVLMERNPFLVSLI